MFALKIFLVVVADVDAINADPVQCAKQEDCEYAQVCRGVKTGECVNRGVHGFAASSDDAYLMRRPLALRSFRRDATTCVSDADCGDASYCNGGAKGECVNCGRKGKCGFVKKFLSGDTDCECTEEN